MRVTASVVKEFESHQKEYGTKIAIQNLFWTFAADQLMDLGVKRVRTEYRSERQGTILEHDHAKNATLYP